MSTTFTWSISTLDRTVADGIVDTVHYRVDANDGTTKADSYGTVSLQAPAEGDSVIPYSDLTADICIGWTKAALGGDEKVTEIQAALQAKIDEQRAPSKVSGMPW